MRVHPSAFPLKTKKIMKKSLFMAAVLLLSLCMFTFSACARQRFLASSPEAYQER